MFIIETFFVVFVVAEMSERFSVNPFITLAEVRKNRLFLQTKRHFDLFGVPLLVREDK